MRSNTRLAALVSLALLAAACTSNGVAPTTTLAVSNSTVAAAPAGTATTVAPGPAAPEPDPTPLPVEPDVRMGVLDNGLTYYARSNDSPGNSVSLRLVVNAGSLQEDVAGSGLAHFVEHMLFNGTERWPGNTLDAELQRLGAQLGPDLNAYTSFDETVYMLDLQTVARDTVETGFDILDQWASAASFDPAEVEAERGVVREEFRLNVEGPGWDAYQRISDAYYGGTVYEGRLPIGGDPEAILTTTAEQARLFYDRWYRPDQMAVIAVGDLPVAYLEQEILDRFTDDVARADSPERIDPTLPMIVEPIVDVVADPTQTFRYVSLDFTIPVWDMTTVGGEQLDTWEQVIAFMISSRLTEAATAGSADLIDPFATVFQDSRNRRFLGFNFDGAESGQALADVLGILETIEADGFTDAELDRTVIGVRSSLDGYAASLETIQDADLAALYTDHFLAGVDISDPQDLIDRLHGILDSVDAATLTEHYRWLMSQSAPVVIVAGPDVDELPTVEELTRIVEESSAGGAADDVAEISALMETPAPVAAEPSEVDQIDGAMRWDYENGVTVAFVESDLAPESVSLYTESSGGWSTLPEGSSALVDLVTSTVARSGFAELDRVAIDRYLADKRVGIAPYVGETTEGFSGNAATDDLETLFQLLHLFVTSPRADETAYNQAVAAERELATASGDDPWIAADNALAEARYGDTAASRPLYATLDQLEAFSREQALELFRERFDDVDDMVVVIAGDVDADTVEDLASRYLGTLPVGPDDTWVDLSPPPPTGVTTARVRAGEPDSAGNVTVLATAPITSDQITVKHDATAMVLTQILQTRLFETVREDLGATYGGQAWVSTTREPDVELTLNIDIEGDPDRVDEILAVATDQVEQVASAGPSGEEFDRATSVLLTDLGFIDLGSVMDQLYWAVTAPDQPVRTSTALSAAIRKLTAVDVRDMLASILAGDSWIEVIRVPVG